MKDYFGIGFSMSVEVVDDLVANEVEQLNSEIKQHYPEFETFIKNLASLSYAKGYEKAKKEDIKELERVQL